MTTTLNTKQKSTIRAYKHLLKLSNPDVNGLILDYLGNHITHYCEDCNKVVDDWMTNEDCFGKNNKKYCADCYDVCEDCKIIKENYDMEQIFCEDDSEGNGKNVCNDCIVKDRYNDDDNDENKNKKYFFCNGHQENRCNCGCIVKWKCNRCENVYCQWCIDDDEIYYCFECGDCYCCEKFYKIDNQLCCYKCCKVRVVYPNGYNKFK